MKNYVKPAVSFQFFNLATNASGGCALSSSQAEYDCPVQIPDWPEDTTIFVENRCSVSGNPDDFGICYGVPIADSRVLGS